MLLLFVALAGALLAAQGRVNGALGGRLGSYVVAALVSFLVGTLLLALAALRRTSRVGARRLWAARPPLWCWLGGLAGAAVVGFSAAAVPPLGVSIVQVCLVAGQTAGGLVADRLGLGPGGREVVSGVRLLGAGLAVAAVGLTAIGDRGASFRPFLMVGLLVAGFASAGQQAANGRLRQASDEPIVPALVSFVSGDLLLALVVAAEAVAGHLAHLHWPGALWLYSGGAAGAVYIVIAAGAVASLGVLRLTLATVAGQLVGALVLDVVLPAPGAHLRAATVIGVALTLVAVAIGNRRSRRPEAVAQRP